MHVVWALLDLLVKIVGSKYEIQLNLAALLSVPDSLREKILMARQSLIQPANQKNPESVTNRKSKHDGLIRK